LLVNSSLRERFCLCSSGNRLSHSCFCCRRRCGRFSARGRPTCACFLYLIATHVAALGLQEVTYWVSSIKVMSFLGSAWLDEGPSFYGLSRFALQVVTVLEDASALLFCARHVSVLLAELLNGSTGRRNRQLPPIDDFPVDSVKKGVSFYFGGTVRSCSQATALVSV
jgi:hypothetical protein